MKPFAHIRRMLPLVALTTAAVTATITTSAQTASGLAPAGEQRIRMNTSSAVNANWTVRFGGPYYSHLFIDKIYAKSDPIIPCQSVFDVQIAARLGFGEVVVDQFEPIGLRGGREDRTVFVLVSRVEGHFGAAGADIADFEQQEPVEEPVRLAVAVGVGDVVFHAVDAPVAVAGASGIDQHHVRGRAGLGFAGGLCRGRQHAGQCRQ